MSQGRDPGHAPTVAVTGLNATDNPAPGGGVIRALRADKRVIEDGL